MASTEYVRIDPATGAGRGVVRGRVRVLLPLTSVLEAWRRARLPAYGADGVWSRRAARPAQTKPLTRTAPVARPGTDALPLASLVSREGIGHVQVLPNLLIWH